MLGRILRHIAATRHGMRRAFPQRVLQAIQEAIARGERMHGGQLRFAIETELAWPALLAGTTAQQRAIDVFSQLRVWDTEHNNGVLLYILYADRDVEIVADRGFNGRVAPDTWRAICEAMQRRFTDGEFEAGAVEGIDSLSRVIASCYPKQGEGPGNEMPDQPVVL